MDNWLDAWCPHPKEGPPLQNTSTAEQAVEPWQCKGGDLFKVMFDQQEFVLADWDGTGSLLTPVPADIELYLRTSYGEGWREPPAPGSEWHWVWSLHNLNSVHRDMGKKICRYVAISDITILTLSSVEWRMCRYSSSEIHGLSNG